MKQKSAITLFALAAACATALAAATPFQYPPAELQAPQAKK